MVPHHLPPRLRDAQKDQGRLVGPVKRPLDHLGDDRHIGEGTSLEVDGILEAQKSGDRHKNRGRATYGCRNVSTGDALDGCIEIIERFALHDLSTDLTADTEGRETTLHNDEPVYWLAWHPSIARGWDTPVGLLDRVLDSVHVKGTDATEVDDLRLDTLLGKLLRGLHTPRYHQAVRNNGDVAALTLNLRLADRKDEIIGHRLLRHGEADTVQHLVLEEHDRVRITDGGL